MDVCVEATPLCPECSTPLDVLERLITGVRMRGYQCAHCNMLYFDERQVVRLASTIKRRVQEGLPSGFEEAEAGDTTTG